MMEVVIVVMTTGAIRCEKL